MSKQYCFDITNPTDDMDIKGLKKFVEQLYVGKGENHFKKDEALPYVVIYDKPDQSICVVATSVAKKNISQIEATNKKLKANKLVFQGIQLKEPYVFNVEAEEWWENKPNVKGERWKTLSQRGPYFGFLLDPYESLGASLIYEGTNYPLDPEEERIASFYAKRKISEEAGGVVDLWTKDPVFNKNFFTDFKKYLTKDHKKIFKDFSKINWTDLVNKITEQKEYELTPEEKREKKVRTEEINREYGYAYIDEHREKVGNFRVEPASIFYGRGKNPNRGKIKKDVEPKEVTINIGEKDLVPPPPPGHKWGEVVHEKKNVWLAKWTDSITGEPKYVFFSNEGKFKGESDLIKYEKARKLNNHIETVRERYMVDAISSDLTKKQLGTVLYLIDHMGIRVGNEKGEDEAETFGATTLQVDHVETKPPDHIIFDFLGKDSIRFYKDIQVPELIYRNFQLFMRGKGKTEDLFDKISARSVNAYLKEFDVTFSAKVFRTRLASSIMYTSLKDIKVPKKADKAKTKFLFNKANIKVAEVLNHTRNVSKKAEEAVKKDKAKLKELEKEYKKLDGAKKAKMKEKIQKLKDKIADKTDVMKVAMSTSLTNYIDPRVVISWSLRQSANLESIYTKALLRKFKWAIDTTDKDWDYITSPLLGNSELEPVVGDEPAVSIGKKDKKKKDSKKKPTPSKPKLPPVGDEPDIQDVRAWLRIKYGANWWDISPALKRQRKEEAVEALKAGAQPVPEIVVTPQVSDPKSILGPGNIQDYKILLEICEDPDHKKHKIIYVSKEALKWIYQFSKYAIANGIDVKVNEYIVKFYNAAYGNK